MTGLEVLEFSRNAINGSGIIWNGRILYLWTYWLWFRSVTAMISSSVHLASCAMLPIIRRAAAWCVSNTRLGIACMMLEWISPDILSESCQNIINGLAWRFLIQANTRRRRLLVLKCKSNQLRNKTNLSVRQYSYLNAFRCFTDHEVIFHEIQSVLCQRPFS